MKRTRRWHGATESLPRVRIAALSATAEHDLEEGTSTLFKHALAADSHADRQLLRLSMTVAEPKYDLWATDARPPRRIERMPDTCNYPAKIERDEEGRYVVTFPDFGWGATDGATRDEALAEARDLLRELVATTTREGRDLPDPSRASRRRPLVIPPVQMASRNLKSR